MRLNLLQEEVAARLKVHAATLRSWEHDLNVPAVRHMPALIAFLGYDPYPAPRTLPEKLSALRRHLGLTRRRMAEKLHIKPDRLAGFEQGRSEPERRLREEIVAFLERHLSPTW